LRLMEAASPRWLRRRDTTRRCATCPSRCGTRHAPGSRSRSPSSWRREGLGGRPRCDPQAPAFHHDHGRPADVRHRRRSRDGGPGAQERPLEGARRLVRPFHHLRVEHVEPHDRGDGGRHEARRPFRGVAFLQPRAAHALVEVVRTVTTSEESLRRALRSPNRSARAVVAKDNSGFIVNLLLVPYLLDAIRAVERGVGSIPDIDKAMQLGCGYPMGRSPCSTSWAWIRRTRSPRSCSPSTASSATPLLHSSSAWCWPA